MPVIGNQIIKTGYETHITLAGGQKSNGYGVIRFMDLMLSLLTAPLE